MATVLVSPRARRDLQRLIETHSLPASTTARVAASIAPLAEFPSIGAPLTGRWARFRFLLGPWRWLLIIYEYDENQDVVGIATVQDARASGAATASR